MGMNSKTKTKLFSLGPKDFKVETFAVGGTGGSGKDTSNTGVRITHPASGATGVSRDERSQLQNKKRAFERLCASEKFKNWLKIKTAYSIQGISETEQEFERALRRRVDEAMKEENLRVETYNPEEDKK